MNKSYHLLKKGILYTLIICSLFTVVGYVYLYVLPKGPAITTTSKIKNGKDAFVMYAYTTTKRKSIRIWTYKPEGWKDKDPIVFIMHGGGRNAEDYLDAWVEIAQKNNLLLLAPEFANTFKNYTTNDYQEGNLFTFFGTPNPKEEWAYSIIENTFDHIKATHKISNEQYAIFGHSAGGQFVHRMMLLMPEARISTGIAANAGFYSFPNEQLEFPYGLKNTEAKLQEAYNKKLVVLLGALDNDPALGTFRTTAQAMQQGRHRLERGSTFFNANKELSATHKWNFNWELDTIPNVGHDYKKMSLHAAEWLTPQS